MNTSKKNDLNQIQNITDKFMAMIPPPAINNLSI